jgi:hypothetical protein
MRFIKTMALCITGLILTIGGMAQSQAQLINGSGAEIFILNEGDVGEFTTLKFGSLADKFLQWDTTNVRFNLNDTLRVSGNLEQEGVVMTFDADNNNVGANIDIVANQGSDNDGTIRYNATTNQWELSNNGGEFESIVSGNSGGGGLAPFLESVSGGTMSPSATSTLTLVGENLDYNTTVSIPGWEGSVGATRYISAHQIEVDVTAGNTETTYSVVLSNGGLDSTNYQIDNGEAALSVQTSAWIDLRAGGAAFTAGNASGNDIRHDATMTMVRDSNGMYFTGENPWGSWAKFESEQFTRGTGQTVEWIFATDGNMMLGVSGLTTDESSASQWQQGGVMGYFASGTSFNGYYGSSPSAGSTWNQTATATVSANVILKLKIENDGSSGENLTLYQLPSASPSDWDDESTVLSTTVSNNNNTQTPIVPFLIPRNSANNYFVALKVQ